MQKNDRPRTMIGIDGGGTKTEFVLFDEIGRVLGRMRLGTSNPSSIGHERCYAVLGEGIGALMERSPEVSCIFAGMAGVLSAASRNKVRAYMKERYPNITTQVETDGINVMLSGKNSDDGMALICGTGSVLIVKEKGCTYRFGGYGSLIDDAGSGYTIARHALRAVLHAIDGIGEPTMLTDMIQAHLGCEIWDGMNQLYQSGKDSIAAMAPMVFRAHALGDAVATDILETNAAELAKLINAARRRHDCPDEITVCGGIFEHTHETFEPMVRRHLDAPLHFIYPELPPVYGACVGCCRAMGIEIDEKFYQNFKTSYHAQVEA